VFLSPTSHGGTPVCVSCHEHQSVFHVTECPEREIERVLFIGTQFSNLYTAVDTPLVIGTKFTLVTSTRS
jgi:hypothetical protein